MRILFNASSIVKGGGRQRVLSFLREMSADPLGHRWCIAVSRVQASEVQDSCRACDFRIFDHRPSQHQPTRRQLFELEREFRPDGIYTLFGPAYVAFRRPHLMGCADGWTTHATTLAYRTLRFPDEWLRLGLTSMYKRLWFRKADAWVVETEFARRALSRCIGAPLAKIAVVPNTCGAHYRIRETRRDFVHGRRKIRLLCFAAPYPHKRLELIPLVAAELRRRNADLEFEFLLTLPVDCGVWKKIQCLAVTHHVEKQIVNRGPIPIAEGPDLYDSCDICFLPTVLETFSCTYPEAMAMGLPVVTTDLGFARDVCGPAALYFPPNDVVAAAAAIQTLVVDEKLWDRLISININYICTPVDGPEY